jgi:sigma-70-like protein
VPGALRHRRWTPGTEAELEFREFFAAEYGRLRGLGYLLTSDWAEAEELAQDALVRTYRAWSRVRRHERPGASRPASGRSWCCATTRTCPRPRSPACSACPVSGQPGPERWMTAPLVATAPPPGFEVEVPAGWEANATWKGIELRPASPELRPHLVGPVQLVTSVLEEFCNPAPNTWKGGTYEDRTELPRTVPRRPEGRQSRGSFPGDNRWFRTDLQEGRWRTTQWHIAWPYRCRPGVPCPALLALRTLKVVYQVDGDAAQVDRLAERLLRTARPIANAVKGQPHAPRPNCVDGRSMVLRREGGDTIDFPGPITVAHFYWWARTSANLVPCTVRGPLGVELLDRSDPHALDRRARPEPGDPDHRARLHRPLQAVAAHGRGDPPLARRAGRPGR